jgi:hypothetical protein
MLNGQSNEHFGESFGLKCCGFRPDPPNPDNQEYIAAIDSLMAVFGASTANDCELDGVQ